MARVLITGSVQGLGLMAGRLLADAGHAVTLHARTAARADDARAALPAAEAVVVGDLASTAAVRDVAAQADALGRFDAVVHNAGVYLEQRRTVTEDGLSHVFAVNVMAPYLLTALLARPDRLVYLTSGMSRGGSADLGDLQWERRRWSPSGAYADSKLLDLALALAVARRWPGVRSNAVDPGWVATRMGGPAATDDLALGPDTQAWLAAGDDPSSRVTGRYLYHRREQPVPAAAADPAFGDALLDELARITATALPPA